MTITKALRVALAFVAIDSLIRISVLYFCFFSPENMPDLPVYYKGVLHPEMQAGILAFDAFGLLACALPVFRTPGTFRVLGLGFVLYGVLSLVLQFFYSANVVGTGFVYCWVAAEMFRIAKNSPGLQPAAGTT